MLKAPEQASATPPSGPGRGLRPGTRWTGEHFLLTMEVSVDYRWFEVDNAQSEAFMQRVGDAADECNVVRFIHFAWHDDGSCALLVRPKEDRDGKVTARAVLDTLRAAFDKMGDLDG